MRSLDVQLGRRSFLAAMLAGAAAGAAGCGFSDDGEPSGEGSTGSGKPVGGTLRQSMLPVPHIDPAFNGSVSARGNLLQTGLLEGLVVRDAEDGSNVLPGVAEKWTASDDGLTYTFSLRADAVWSNGDKVTAEDFLWNWERYLSPASAELNENAQSANASMKNVAGAAAFFGGSEKDFATVGIKAPDESTVEFTLATPDPLFLPTLSAWRTLPLHPATVEEHPDDWFTPEVWVGNGAFVLSEWRANSGATLVRNESYWDIDGYSIDTWEVKFNDGGDTAQMVSYQADEIDTFMVEGDPAAITTDPELKKQLQTAEPTQFKCLVRMVSKNPVLEDVRVRKALSLAIDREAIAGIAEPDTAANNLIPSGVEGYDQVHATEFDPDQAKDLLDQAGYPGGKGVPTLSMLVFTPTPWVEAVGDMWREHLGVKTAVDTVEVGVYGKKRVAVHDKNYVGFSYGYFGLTPPTLYQALSTIGNFGSFAMPAAAAEEFQNAQTSTKLSPADKAEITNRLLHNDVFPEYKKYVDLVEQARTVATDPDAMQDLLIQAASAREQSYVALPVLWAGYSFMVKPQVHNLKVTSLPDQVFTLKGVTIEG